MTDTPDTEPLCVEARPGLTRRASCGLLLTLPLSGAAAQTPPQVRPTPGAAGMFTAKAEGAHTRSFAEKLDDYALSVMDFMSPEQISDARQRLGRIDCTAAFNAAFDAAQRSGRTVYVPDGVYLVGNLRFGSQSTSAGSLSPLGLLGQSKLGTILRARAGLTGTVLQSWSITGVTFSDFTIETAGTAAMAWDCRWKAGDGPSTQNVIRHIIVTGGTAPVHVNWDNLNDTYPTEVTVRVDDRQAASCGISMVQGGGLSLLRGCIWSGCFLRFGSQNGKIDGCWGHGIEFAKGCTNHVEISAGYFYGNPTHKSVFWSQSYSSFNSVRALVCTATQFVTENTPTAAYFDLNAYSILKFTACQWLGPTPALIGARARTDSYATVLVRIEGGTHTGKLTLGDRPGFEIECDAFMNDATGRMVTKARGGSFVPEVRGNGRTPGTYARGGKTFGRYRRQGNIVHFRLRIEWSGHSAAGNNASLYILGLPLEFDADGVETVTLEYSGSSFAGRNVRANFANGAIAFLTADGGPVALPRDGDLILSGNYSVTA